MIKAVHDAVITTTHLFSAGTKLGSATKIPQDVWYKARCPNLECGTKYYLKSTEVFASPTDSMSAASSEAISRTEAAEGMDLRSGRDHRATSLQAKNLECPHCHSVIQVDLNFPVQGEGLESWLRPKQFIGDLKPLPEDSFVASLFAKISPAIPWIDRLEGMFQRFKASAFYKSLRMKVRRALRHSRYQVTVIKISTLVAAFSILLFFSGFETFPLKRYARQMISGKPKGTVSSVKLQAGASSAAFSESNRWAVEWLDQTYTTIRRMDFEIEPSVVENFYAEWEVRCSNELKARNPTPAMMRAMAKVRYELRRVVELLQQTPKNAVELEEVQLIVLESLSDSVDAADRLAELVSVDFKLSHGSNRFDQASLNFLLECRKSYTFLKEQTPSRLVDDKRNVAQHFKSRLRYQFALIPPKSQHATTEEKQLRQLFNATISALDTYKSINSRSVIAARDTTRSHLSSVPAAPVPDARGLYMELRTLKQVLQKTELALHVENLNDLPTDVNADIGSDFVEREFGSTASAGR